MFVASREQFLQNTFVHSNTDVPTNKLICALKNVIHSTADNFVVCELILMIFFLCWKEDIFKVVS